MLTILLVDDDDLVRETVAVSLADRGFSVFQAIHGRDALDTLGRQATSFDAIVLDIMMPEMEGIEALREIRRRWPRMPVLVISGGDRTGWTSALDMASKLGANRILSKPFTPKQLVENIERMIEEEARTNRAP